MPNIHVLSPEIIAKIAAGEVIERPVFAVKELIENAIDAGATSIIIQIEQAGLKKIVVTDNGHGMTYDDLVMSYQTHTTSKISTPDELHGIKTLGFRGEALSSIAAISDLTIASRTADKPGGQAVEIVQGKITRDTPIGMPVGTTVTVDQLFYSVPVRKHFLKSQITEFRHILSLVTSIALAYPEIHFSLSHNKKTLFDVPKDQSLPERLQKILGNEIVQNLIPISATDMYVKINGFLGVPAIAGTTSAKQFLFINKRLVSDKNLSAAIKEAYGNSLAQTGQPTFVLFIDLPYEAVEVNVHPRKEQVQLLENRLIFEQIKEAIAKQLSKNQLTYQSLAALSKKLGRHNSLTKSLAASAVRDEVVPYDVRSNVDFDPNAPIVQLHNLYLVVPTKQGFLLIDQHAAHERILYEQYKEAFLQKKQMSPSIRLKTPIALDLSLAEQELLAEYLSELQNIGFVFEIISSPVRSSSAGARSFAFAQDDNTVVLEKIPKLLYDRDPVALIREMLEDLYERGRSKTLDTRTNLMLATLACRSAVMAGEPLSPDQCRNVVEKLKATPQNTTCPHGRPTTIAVTLKELAQLFKR